MDAQGSACERLTEVWRRFVKADLCTFDSPNSLGFRFMRISGNTVRVFFMGNKPS
jgi:hypothetical protein